MPKDKSANRIFVGYPWKTYRAHWEKALLDAHKRSPLHFMASRHLHGVTNPASGSPYKCPSSRAAALAENARGRQ